MSLGVSSGDLIGSWSLSFSDIAFVTGKAETARLGLAVQLRFFAGHGFFVPDHASIPSDGVLYLAEQLGLDAKSVNHYDFSGRTARRHCAEILRHLGFRRMTQTDRRALSRWISDDLCAGGQPINAMLEHVFLWCRDRRIYGPSRKEAQSARSCDFGHLGEHVGNGLVVVDDRPCEERRSAPIRERRYEPWRFEWGSDWLLEPEFFGHRVRDRQSGDGTTGLDRKSTRLNSSHLCRSRMQSSA